VSIAERGTSGARRKEVKRRFVRDETDRWLAQRGVTLIGADLDESPMAYRRLPQAGEGEFDPWKG